MEIQYLKYFQQNPRSILSDSTKVPNTPLSLSEIQQLEQQWNNGTQFPTVVREFLSIGGSYNWIFEGGNQVRLRESIQSLAQKVNYQITRPYIGINVALSDPQFFIIFLDESQIDPIVYELNLYTNIELEHYELSRLKSTGTKLSNYINGAIESYRSWQNKGLI